MGAAIPRYTDIYWNASIIGAIEYLKKSRHRTRREVPRHPRLKPKGTRQAGDHNVGDTVRVLEVASTGLWAGREGTYVLGGDDGENYPHTVSIPGVPAVGFRDEEIELVRRAPIRSRRFPSSRRILSSRAFQLCQGFTSTRTKTPWALLENGGQWYATWSTFPWQAMSPNSVDGPFTSLYAHLKGLEA